MNEPDWNEEQQNQRGTLNEFHSYGCAFCGEDNEVFVDGSGARQQQFTEDCAVCCRPNLLTITIHHDDSVDVGAEREYDA